MDLKLYKKNLLEDDYITRLNEAVTELENPFTDFPDPQAPLIFIVGAPRSGTTLLSQFLSYSLPVGYINNLIARFWEKPSLGVLLSKRLLTNYGKDTISFKSKHGTTSTIGDPHEFGNFWSKWLNLDKCKTHHLTSSELKSIDRVSLRRTLIQELLIPFNRPVLFKNVICGFHAELLTKIYKNSLFIYIERNNLEIISSILKVRKERFGNESEWWSLKPSVYPDAVLSNDPIEEVTNQVVYCKQEMYSEVCKKNVNTYLLEYEKLCREPNVILEEISKKIKIMFDGDFIVPKTLLEFKENNNEIPETLKNAIMKTLRKSL